MRVLGLAGLALAALGWVLAPAVFASAWLAALTVWLGWPLGSLGLLLLHRLTGGAWGEALAPGLWRGVRALWLLVPALAPLLLTAPTLYPWLRAGGFGVYLTLPFFAARGALTLAAWLALGALALRAGRRGSIPVPLAVLGLATLAVTLTFAAIDLTLALEPGISMSAYGLDAIADTMTLAAAMAVLLQPAAARPAGGGLLLATAMIWGYVDFTQFLIVAQSNLPSDAPWFARRLAGGWFVLGTAVSALHLVIPVGVLLSRRMRASPPVLTAVAALMVLGVVLRGWWVVLPALHRGLSWVDFACLAAFAGALAAVPPRPVPQPAHG